MLAKRLQISIFFLVLNILACSSKFQDGQEDRLYSVLPPLEPAIIRGDPGLHNPRDPELNLPGLNLKSFLGGEHIHGGKVYKIQWFLMPVDSEDEGLYSTKIEYSKDGGTTWVVLVESVPSVGNTLVEYDWNVGAGTEWEGNLYKLRLSTTNVYGIKFSKTTEEPFTIDNSPPTLKDGALKVNLNQSTNVPGQGWTKIELSRSYMAVNFSAQDSLSSVTEFCIKMDTTIPPKEDDECWKILNNMGITPALSIDVADAPAFVGFVARNADIRLWVKDEAGNVSSLIGGTGQYNTDRAAVIFNPALPPEVENVLVSNVSNPSIPPTRNELNTSTGNSKVYIKWKILPKGKGQLNNNNGVRLEYTTDEVNFFPITTEVIRDQANTANGSCFTDGDDKLFSGCYTWAGPNIPSTYFRARVIATNDVGLVTATTSDPLNAGFFRNVAGNTDSGVGNSAESAMYFYNGGGDTSWTNPGSIAVTRRGRIYVRDDKMGIMVIDPSDGINRVFIRRGDPNLPFQEGEDVDVSLAKTVPIRISVDYQDRLLILEKDRVRRVDANNIISTLIGVKPGPDGTLLTGYERYKDNGLIAGDNKANWFKKDGNGNYKYLTADGCFSVYTTPGVPAQYYEFKNNGSGTFMWPLPNGDIYFSTSDFWGKSVQSAVEKEPYFAVYKESDARGNSAKRVYPLRLCGTGVNYASQNPFKNHSDLKIDSIPAINFNPNNSMVESFSFRTYTNEETGYYKPYGVTFNPRSGKSRGANTIYPLPAFGGGNAWHGGSSYVPTRKGSLLFQHYIGGVLKYNGSYNQWEPLFNLWRNGQCYDGTKAKDCYVDILDTFITEDSVVYFFDRGRIRAISNNKVKTIFGQSRKYGDDQNPSTARFNMIEYLGVWGDDNRIVAYDTREYVAREIEPGIKIKKIMGTNGEGKCEEVDGEYSCTTGYYNWGSPNAKIGNSFSTDTRSGSLNMDASWWGIHYWDWSTGFAVDRDNGDIYSYSGGGPFHGIARYFRTIDSESQLEKRRGQMILGQYSDSKYFLTTGENSCDGKSALGCRIDYSPDSGNGLNSGWDYAVVVPTIGVDKVSGKKTIIATTHDWSLDHYNEKNQWIGSHKHCFMKAIRLPNGTPELGPISSGSLGSSIVQHVMGTNDRCAGYGGNGEGLPADGTVMTSNSNFPSWHSTTIPHRFILEEDAILMSWRGSSRIVKVPFVRGSANGHDDLIVGTAAITTAVSLPRGVLSYNYRVNGLGKIQYFYCGTDLKLYKYEGGIETLLPFPDGSGITCHDRGKALEWSKDKTVFYFVYTQNGLTGIGEYFVGE